MRQLLNRHRVQKRFQQRVIKPVRQVYFWLRFHREYDADKALLVAEVSQEKRDAPDTSIIHGLCVDY